jgi:hypothetical protein
MTTSAVRDTQSPLEAALVDVHAALADLLVAADEQHAAVVARDHERLESVTRQQERLSARLAHAEARRLEVLAGTPLAEALSALPTPEHSRAEALRMSIASAVGELKRRQEQTTSLLEQSIQLASQTLDYLRRLVGVQPAPYGGRGFATANYSVFLDRRA